MRAIICCWVDRKSNLQIIKRKSNDYDIMESCRKLINRITLRALKSNKRKRWNFKRCKIISWRSYIFYIRNRKTNKPIIDIRITGFLLCIKFKPTNFLYSIRLCIYHLPKSFKKLCVKYSKNTINATVICNL